MNKKYSVHCNKLLVKETDEFEDNVFPKFKSDYNSWRNAYKNGDLRNCYTTDISGGNPDISGNLKYNLSSCPEFTNFYKKTSMCKKAEKERPGFTPYIGSTRDSDLQIFVKMFITVICTTILFLIFVAMACASWVNTYKVSYHLFPPKDDSKKVFSKEDADAKKKRKVMECTDTSKYPYVGTKEESKPGREYDCKQIDNYFRVNFLHDFIEKRLYSKLVPSKLLVRSLKSFGKEYINPDGSENIEKYKSEHVTKILTDPKNIPKFDSKILYHFWKSKMIPDDKNKMIQIFEKDMPPLKEEHKQIMVEKKELEEGEETNDPYDIILGQLYEEIKKLEDEKASDGDDQDSDEQAKKDAEKKAMDEAMKDMTPTQKMAAKKAMEAQAALEKGPEILNLERKIKNIKSYRKNLLKRLKKVKIGPSIAIPKNKWHGFTESKTFRLKLLAAAALILQSILLIWRSFHNIYMTVLSKITKNPTGKGSLGKGFSFFLHFIVANPVFIGAIVSTVGSLSTTGGIIAGIAYYAKRLSKTKNIRNLESFFDKIKFFLHSILNLVYNLVMFALGILIIAIIMPYLLLFFPYHHAMTLMGSLRKSKEPDISVAETIHKSICRGVSIPFIIVLGGIMSVLFSEKRRYVPCVAGPMSEVDYQNKEYSNERKRDTEMEATLNNNTLNNLKETRTGNRNELFSTVLIATAVLILGYKKIMG